MDEDLKQYLEGMENRIVDRIVQRVDGRIDAVGERMKEYVSAACEKVETTLLREFQKWGRTSDMRTRQALTEAALLNERLLAVEDRVTALERGGK